MIKYITNLFSNDNRDAKDAKRFEKTIEILKKEKVQYIEWLPVYSSRYLRSKEEICIRAICLMIVALKGEGLEHDIVLKIAKQYDVLDHFTPEEKEFLAQEVYLYVTRAKFTWRYESYWTLLWMLGYLDRLERPENICDPAQAVSIIRARSKEQFIKDARLRDIEEILDLADLTRRYHWVIRNDKLKENIPSTNLDGGVVYERHCAFAWALDKESSWDQANTST